MSPNTEDTDITRFRGKRVAFFGNMNNVNFSLMRYFRDLGIDAHLLLTLHDGIGDLSHFKPEYDTWNYSRWAPYIHQTGIPNAPVAALEGPIAWFMSVRSKLSNLLGRHSSYSPAVSKRQIEDSFEGYDYVIGSGLAPAIFERIGRRLDVFWPYSYGVEFLGGEQFADRVAQSSGISRKIFEAIIKRQAAGVRQARSVIISDFGLTYEVLRREGANVKNLNCPLVYNNEAIPEAPPSKRLASLHKELSESDFTLLHHARLYWVRPEHMSDSEWTRQSKNNNWFLEAFAAFAAERQDLRTKVAIVEYGKDVAKTKELVENLGIAPNVVWLPIMERRELRWLIDNVDVVCGEFMDVQRMILGCTGWEALAGGKPLLQGFIFDEGEYETLYNSTPPPMLAITGPDDILMQLRSGAAAPERLRQIGFAGLDWFNHQNGASLAREWAALL